MAKLNRLTAKIFGETASTTNTPKEIGQFGSAKAGTYNATGDVATIQSLPAWSNGWIDAVTPTDQFPPLPEMTGVHKVLSYQNAYVLQEGVPEYDASTTYYQNSICKGINSEDNLVFYKSLVDNNIGNALSDNNYWEELAFGGGSRNIGEVVTSTIPLTDAGLHLLDGSKLQYGSYKSFIDYIADLYDSGDYSAIFDTEANWQSAVATSGICNKFVYDSVNNTVRLPKYGNQIITKSPTVPNTVPVVGNGKTLGVTNGTTKSGMCYEGSYGFTGSVAALGATLPHSASGNAYASTNVGIGITTDGTVSGLIANLSSITNYPLNCYYYIVIATSTKTDIQVDIDQIATDLNGKADVDLSNINASCKPIDGQWIASSSSIASGVSLPKTSNLSYSLSSYLPADSSTYDYEVLFNGFIQTGSATGNIASLTITGLFSADVARCRTTTASTVSSQGCAIVPISHSNRNIVVELNSNNTGTFNLNAVGYRRIGINQ